MGQLHYLWGKKVEQSIIVLGTLTLTIPSHLQFNHIYLWGRTGLMVRASDFGSGDPGSILGRVGVFVSLSKRHLLPKSTGNTQE